MKVLWLVKKPLHVLGDSLGLDIGPTGGWLDGISSQLIKNKEITLCVCFSVAGLETYGESNGVKYFTFDDKKLKSMWNIDAKNRLKSCLEWFEPDVITVFGTEGYFQSEALKWLNDSNYKDITSVWIQGLIGIYHDHYDAGLPLHVINRVTVKECITGYTTRKDLNSFKTRGKNEYLALSGVQNVFGRTDWDKAVTKQYNDQRNYYFCNETLRNSFYNNRWEIDNIERHSIFVSQCQTPLKGLHRVIEAVDILRHRYPDVKVYTTGRNLSTPTFEEKLRFSSYQKYLYDSIKKRHLEENIVFLGSLDEKEMCERFLKSHVFVSASSIENSPNSVGEAMILGVPTVSSYVGGVYNMLEHEKEGFLYQADAPYMMAYYISRIFDDDNLAMSLSNNAAKRGSDIFDREKNCQTLIEAYNDIISQGKADKG